MEGTSSTAPTSTVQATTTAAPMDAGLTETMEGTAALSAGAPARRFAPKVVRAEATSARVLAKPSYVFLRVKRKRHEDPVEHLVVPSQPESKRVHAVSGVKDAGAATADDAATMVPTSPSVSSSSSSSSLGPAASSSRSAQRELLAAFSNLSTKERGFVFKRIDTMESHQVSDVSDARWTSRLKKKVKSLKAAASAQQQQRVNAKKMTKASARDGVSTVARQHMEQQRILGRERRRSEVSRSRGLAAPLAMTERRTTEVSGIRVVDIDTVPASTKEDRAPSPSESVPPASTAVTLNGAKLATTRVMNPHEREVDEAIWLAFRHNDFSSFFRLFYRHRPGEKTSVDPTTFQRLVDGLTILMAAARHGRADVIEVVLRADKVSVLQQDWRGITAAAYAQQHGHTSIETALRACEEAEREKEYVYDVYCIDMAASESSQMSLAGGDRSGVQDMAGSERDNEALARAPVVSVSPAVQRWLSQEAGQAVGADEREAEEYMLESDFDSNAEDDGESIDSNDENYEHNDYPDEESSGSEYDSDDSNGIQRMKAPARQHDKDDQICADEFDY